MKAVLAVVLVALLVSACGPLPKLPDPDAAPLFSSGGKQVTSGGGQPVTIRDWNCRRCYS